MEEIGKVGPLHCIFLAEFHPNLGPKICFEYPGNIITKDVFDAVSVYIIPKPQIQKKVITVNAFGFKITGFPNEIENTRYERNALKFNLCFVCKSDSRAIRYEPVVKKLSEYLEHLELENGFLSNVEFRSDINTILKRLLEDLNATSRCPITINLKDRKTSFTAPLCGDDQQTPLRSSRVVERRQTMVSQYRPDKTTAIRGRGITHKSSDTDTKKSMVSERQESQMMSRRASDADTYLKSSKKCQSDFADKRNCDAFRSSDLTDPLQNFRQRGFNKECSNVAELHLKVLDLRPQAEKVQDYHVPVIVCDQIYYKNYLQSWDLITQRIMPYMDGTNHVAKIAALADVHNLLLKECIQNHVHYNVVKLLTIFQYSNVYTVTNKINKLYLDENLKRDCLNVVCMPHTNLPSFKDVFQLYCNMEHGVSIRDICMKYNLKELNIDERKLVKFGLIHGIIRRVHQYPVYSPMRSYESTQPVSRYPSLLKLCTGFNHIDAICCRLCLTYKEVDEEIERDSNIIVICK